MLWLALGGWMSVCVVLSGSRVMRVGECIVYVSVACVSVTSLCQAKMSSRMNARVPICEKGLRE